MARTKHPASRSATAASSAKRSPSRKPAEAEQKTTSADENSSVHTANRAEQERAALRKEEAILGIETALKKFCCSLCKRHVELHQIKPIKMLLGRSKHARVSRKTAFKTKLKPKPTNFGRKRQKPVESDSETTNTDSDTNSNDSDEETHVQDDEKINFLSLDDTISEAAGVKAGCIELVRPENAQKSKKSHSAVDFSTNLACGHIFCVECRSKDGNLFRTTGKKIIVSCPVTTLGRPCGAAMNRNEIQNSHFDANFREVQLYMHMKKTLVELRRLDVTGSHCMDKIRLLLDSKTNEHATPSSSSSSTYRRRDSNDDTSSVVSSAVTNNGVPKKSWKTSRNPLKQILYKLRSTLFPKTSTKPARPIDTEKDVMLHDRNGNEKHATDDESDENLRRSSRRSSRSERSRKSRARAQPASAKKVKLADAEKAVASADELHDKTLQPPAADQHLVEPLQDEKRRSSRRRTAVVSLVTEKGKISSKKSSRRGQRGRTAESSPTTSRLASVDTSIYDEIPDDDDDDDDADADETCSNLSFIDDADDVVELSVSPNSVECLNIKKGDNKSRAGKRVAVAKRRGRAAGDEATSSSTQSRRLTKYKFCVSKNRAGRKNAALLPPDDNPKPTRRRAAKRPVATAADAQSSKAENGGKIDEAEKPKLNFGFNQLAVEVVGTETAATTIDKRISSNKVNFADDLAEFDDALLQSLNRGLGLLNVDTSVVAGAAAAAAAASLDDDDDVMMKSAVDAANADDVENENDDADEFFEQSKKAPASIVGDAVIPNLPDDGNEQTDTAAAEARARAESVHQRREERKQERKNKKIEFNFQPPPPPPAPVRGPQFFSQPSVELLASQPNSITALAANTLLSVNDITAASAVRTILTQSSQGLATTAANAGITNDDDSSVVMIDRVAAEAEANEQNKKTQNSSDNNTDDDDENDDHMQRDKFAHHQQQFHRLNVEKPTHSQATTNSLDLSLLDEPIALSTRYATCNRQQQPPKIDVPPPPPYDAVNADEPDAAAASAAAADITPTNLLSTRRKSFFNHQHTPKPHSTPIADAQQGGSRRVVAALALDISPIQHISPVASSAPAENTRKPGEENAAAFNFNSAVLRHVAGGPVGLHAKRRPSQFAAVESAELPETAAAAAAANPEKNRLFPDDDLSGNQRQQLTCRTGTRREVVPSAARFFEKPPPPQPPQRNFARKVMTQQAYSAAATADELPEPPPPVKFNFDAVDLPKLNKNSQRPSRAIDLDDLINQLGSPQQQQTDEDRLAAAYRIRQQQLLPRRNPRDFVLCSTGVGVAQQLAAIKKFSRDVLHAKYDREFTRETTHLIVVCDERGECARTLKYLQCIAQQKFCMSYEWVQNALENRAKSRSGKNLPAETGDDGLDEFEFLARGDNTMRYGAASSDAPRRCLAIGTKPLARVLVYFGVHAPDDTKSDADWQKEIVLGITRRNYFELLCDMGAQVLLDYREFARATSSSGGDGGGGGHNSFLHKVWLVQTYSARELACCNLLRPAAHFVDMSWLLECISTFSMLPFDAYKPVPPAAADAEVMQNGPNTFDIE